MTIRTSRRTTTAAAVLALALSITACSSATSSTGGSAAGTGGGGGGSANTLNGVGSSAQTAAMQAWTAGFQQANSGVTVNYDPQGSGAGRQQFLAGGNVSFAGSDAAMSADETTQSKSTSTCDSKGAIDIPVYASAIAVVYNVKGVDKLTLDATTIANIFAGKVKTWNDPAIAALNPGVTLPSTAVTAVSRSDKSGTTKNFTDYLAANAPDVWTYGAVDTWPVQGGEQGDGTSGVMQKVTGGDGTIGYADLSAAKGVGIANVKVGDAVVTPSADGAAKDLAESTKASAATGNDLTWTVQRKPTAAGAYPLLLLSYHIVCQDYKNAALGNQVKKFEQYVTSSDGQQAAAKNAGSAPLPDSMLATVKASVDSIQAG